MEVDEDLDFMCAYCDETLLFCAQQEFGQVMTTMQPLILYGQCPRCEEVFTMVYMADIEETADLASNDVLLI